MSEHQAEHRIRVMCRVLGVSASGYYAWEKREPSARERANERLLERIRTLHAKSRKTYGVPRMMFELTDAGEIAGHNRVARLMREDGLVGASRRKGCWTTRRNKDARPAPDLVERKFAADAPDRLWVADITYVPTWAGFLYLAVVLDVFSRRIVGWAMASGFASAEPLVSIVKLRQAMPRVWCISQREARRKYCKVAAPIGDPIYMNERYAMSGKRLLPELDRIAGRPDSASTPLKK